MDEPAWVGVALSSAIKCGTSSGVVVEGREYVIWRDGESTAHVWEDRCPHRGMRMSLGFVRGDHIACLYHGWQYDTAGRCRAIPAHPHLEVPQSIRIQRFGCMERNGILWARLGRATGDDVPDLGVALPLRSLHVDASPDRVWTTLLQPERLDPSGAPLTAGSPVPGLIRLSGADCGVLLALQPMTADRTALHIVLMPTAAHPDLAMRRRWLGWAEALRLRLETRWGDLEGAA